jgi:phytoene desaturase
MSHVDLVQGVYFPHGGMNKMVEGLHLLLEDMGVDIRLNTDVTRIIHADGRATGVETDAGTFQADVVLATGDYHHIEQKLLDQEVRNYSAKYWEKAVVAPSMFIMYLGVGKKLPGLKHHNLFFAREWNIHFDEIFKNPAWPKAKKMCLFSYLWLPDSRRTGISAKSMAIKLSGIWKISVEKIYGTA